MLDATPINVTVDKKVLTQETFRILNAAGYEVVRLSSQEAVDLALAKINATWHAVFVVGSSSDGESSFEAIIQSTHIASINGHYYECHEGVDLHSRARARPFNGHFFTTFIGALAEVARLIESVVESHKRMTIGAID